MRAIFPGLLAGLLFGAGLTISDMINPGRVQAFLDVTGAWDPSLAFVMGAALVPSALAYLVRRRMSRPVFADRFAIPEPAAIDGKLLLGASIFGVGWGLAGYCPGPALAGLVTGGWEPWVFVAAIIAGIGVHRMLMPRLSAPQPLEGRAGPAQS